MVAAELTGVARLVVAGHPGRLAQVGWPDGDPVHDGLERLRSWLSPGR